MYDRETDSYWPQILGEAVNGNREGEEIDTFPVFWTTWEQAKAKYSDALVLSTETGTFRDYNSDPYGSYDKGDSYYNSGGPFFPVMHTSNEFSEKKVVVGIKNGDNVLALDPELVKTKGSLEFDLGNETHSAIYDEGLGAVRVYKGNLDDENKTWQTSFDVFWFAWYAYYPETEVLK
jgi:hypothetical protein